MFTGENYAAPRDVVLYGGAVPLAGPDAQGAVYRGNPYLPVADRFRPGVLGDGLDQGFHVVIEGDDVQPDLVQQRHSGQAGAGPGNELAELSAETTDFGHGQAVSPVVDQGADQLVELVGPDDGCDQFHASSPPFSACTLHMLRMRWNLRMSSLPASSARPVTSRTTHAAVLSAAPVMCFMGPSLSVAPGTDFPGLTRCGAARGQHRRLTVAVRGCCGVGPKIRPCRDLGPGPS